jgi:hypothetical protein
MMPPPWKNCDVRERARICRITCEAVGFKQTTYRKF